MQLQVRALDSRGERRKEKAVLPPSVDLLGGWEAAANGTPPPTGSAQPTPSSHLHQIHCPALCFCADISNRSDSLAWVVPRHVLHSRYKDGPKKAGMRLPLEQKKFALQKKFVNTFLIKKVRTKDFILVRKIKHEC